jgi:hypothetical protein
MISCEEMCVWDRNKYFGKSGFCRCNIFLVGVNVFVEIRHIPICDDFMGDDRGLPKD